MKEEDEILLEINLRNLPDEGRQFTGELPSAVFELPENDPAKAVTPLCYDLFVQRANGLITAKGSISTTFSLVCVRTLERFDFPVALADYMIEETLPGGVMIDLTPRVREDILLALPDYPHRDAGGEPISRTFEFEGRPSDPNRKEGEEAKGVWDALDELN